MRKIFLIILFFLSLSSCSSSKTINPALQDLKFIHKMILENHPGIYNELDPDFNNHLAMSYKIAKSKIIQSSDKNMQKQAINEFAKSFNDTHLYMQWKDTKLNDNKDARFTEFNVLDISKNVSWITLHTFVMNEGLEKQFRKLLKEIHKAAYKKYIVFDLRGNQGGNSDYGSSVIDVIFGKEYASRKRCLANKNVYVDWRSSSGNAAHVESLSERFKGSEWKDISYGLKESVINGKNYYRHYYSTYCCTLKGCDVNIETNNVKTNIIIIIDSGNVSAALDFIDEVKMMTKNVKLIGTQTKADRLYMDVRTELLPSGQGRFVFPIKVYRNRPRGDNEPYRPDIEFEDIGNTELLQKLVLNEML